jgi:hypothetical protein
MNMSFFTSETAEQRRAATDISTNHMITASIASHIIHSRALFSYIYAMRQTSYLGILMDEETIKTPNPICWLFFQLTC